MNIVTLIGRLSRDPDRKEDGNLAKFSIATGFKKKDGSEHTDWHDIDCWGKTAKIALDYLHKGDQVGIQGQIRYNVVEKDGRKHKYTTIIADRIELLGSRQQTAQPSAPAVQPDQFDIPDLDPLDVPF